MSLSVGTETEIAPSTPARRIPFWAWPLALAGVLVALSAIRLVTGISDISSSGTLGATLALAMPLALAGLGGLWSERAGVINIGLEGMMILGTWGAAFGAIHGGPWMGIVGAMVCGAVGGLVHALATVTFGVDHIVSGVALNIVALGVASYLAARFFGELEGGSDVQSPPLPSLPRVGIPGISDPLKSVEDKGWFFVSELAALLRAATTNLSILTVIALLLIVGTWWLLWRTPFGLRVRSCGESPVAAETLGVNVYLYKYVAVTASGALAGLGGGFLAMVASNAYRESQTDGRGYIGLAAMIFGNWRPGGVLMGSGLFGFMDALQLRGGGDAIHALLLLIAVLLVGLGLWQVLRRQRYVQGTIAVAIGVAVGVIFVITETVPGDVTRFAPHLTTLLVLAFASQRLRMPAANGKVYRRGEGH
ncbi:ABC transporter permease [Janibacter sp. RAF20_2_2]|uniref:ABC transporter permease n=1 Tax=unclassified Janibacter TaxID=2649294 RepID=UPI003F8FD880